METLFYSEKYCFYRNVAAVIGVLVVFRLVVRQLCGVLSGVRAFFLAPLGLGCSSIDIKKYGPWAVVTGASEGIGRAYALELARRGLNVVLMSRSEEKLNKVAAEIRELGRESRVIPIDFSAGLEIYKELPKELSDLDIGVLVNNVGCVTKSPLCSLPPERLYKIVQVNCQPVVQMSRLLLPKMVAKGGGVVINISSILAMTALPSGTTYCATKIFVNYISEGMRKEYEKEGIVVQNVMPAFVATAMTKAIGIEKPNLFVTSPEFLARSALNTLGIQRDTFGCLSHAIQGYLIPLVPTLLLLPLLTQLLKLKKD